jgi:hypothetical protein
MRCWQRSRVQRGQRPLSSPLQRGFPRVSFVLTHPERPNLELSTRVVHLLNATGERQPNGSQARARNGYMPDSPQSDVRVDADVGEAAV